MRRTLSLAALMCAVSLLAACGHPVEVPPAYVGKLSTSSGLQKGIVQPSKIMLESWCRNCDSLILAQASDFAVKEEMDVFMPADKLNLHVEIRGTVAISPDPENVEKIFARVPAIATKEDERVRVIGMDIVYATYTQPLVREVTRTIITKYPIQQVMEQRDSIGEEIWSKLREKLAATPTTFVQFGLADVQPPPVIVKAQEAAKEREVGIATAEANKSVRLKEAEADLEVAIKQQQVELKEAETQILVDRKLADVSEAVIAQRSLKVLDKLAGSNNQIFVIPTEMFRNPALLVGFGQQVFRDRPRRTVPNPAALDPAPAAPAAEEP